MPETVPLYLDMSVEEYLRFSGRARKLGGAHLQQRLDWCVEACGLQTELKKQIQELSKGYRQRTGLAQALIHDPEILILDEPTSGLDPLQIIEIRDLIKSLAGKKTILFSTHILQEVAPVTDRIVIINEGRIIADGSARDLSQAAMGSNRVYAGFRRTTDAVETALQELSSAQAVARLSQSGDGSARFELRGPFDGDLLGAVSRLAHERSWELCELREAPFSLEDTFIALTRRTAARGKGVV
jgi:ABC-2 type transport system ATP-binding protein